MSGLATLTKKTLLIYLMFELYTSIGLKSGELPGNK